MKMGNRKQLEDALDFVTSDDYVSDTGDDYFWNLHADIISENFAGDWTWQQAIKYWSDEDIASAIETYTQEK
jgi:hypothetical protein